MATKQTPPGYTGVSNGRILSDITVRNAKPQNKPYSLFDHGRLGVYLLVNPNGSKLWRMKYRFGGVAKLMSLGAYPIVGLKDARSKALEARKLLDQGIDPVAARQANASALRAETTTFRMVADEWLSKQKAWSDDYRIKVVSRFAKEIHPSIGNKPIGTINAEDVLSIIRRAESRGAVDLAHRLAEHISVVFRYAMAADMCNRNPAADLRGILTKVSVVHRAALTKPADVGALMRAIAGYQGSYAVRAALELGARLFVRPGELRRAEWSEFDLDGAEWRIPASKMKMRESHIVPLSRQAVVALKSLHPLTGHGQYVFPSERNHDRYLGEATLNAALRRLGYSKTEMTAHGFRSMASTLLNEIGVHPDVIELQLAHKPRNKVRDAYNRAERLDERREMMQRWSDYLDRLAEGARVIPFPQKQAS